MAYLQEDRTDLNLLTQTELNKFTLINIENKTIKHTKDTLKKLLVNWTILWGFTQ